jgi:hypothetical protein
MAPIVSNRPTASQYSAGHGGEPDLAIEQVLILLRRRPQRGKLEAKRMM